MWEWDWPVGHPGEARQGTMRLRLGIVTSDCAKETEVRLFEFEYEFECNSSSGVGHNVM